MLLFCFLLLILLFHVIMEDINYELNFHSSKMKNWSQNSKVPETTFRLDFQDLFPTIISGCDNKTQ